VNKQAKQQATLQRLRGLADQPDEYIHYAMELLDQERGNQVVSAALAAVTATAPPGARPVLLRLYDYYDAAGVKRDAGGHLRTAILSALLPIAHPADWTLAEHATKTYEFLPPKHEESATGLRAAGLVLLNNLDPVLASYHCVRLLIDPHTSHMSGEPAVSAVRLLAKQVSPLPYQGHLLPLYVYVLDSLLGSRESVPEAVGECLRSLTKAPASVVDGLFAQYTAYSPRTRRLTYETKDDVELAGLFDLLLEHATRDSYLNFLEEFLRTTQRYEVYRYLVTMIVAGHQPKTWIMLLEEARREQDQRKVEILLSVFALVQNDPTVTDLVSELQKKQ